MYFASKSPKGKNKLNPDTAVRVTAGSVSCRLVCGSPLSGRGWRWNPRIFDEPSPRPRSYWFPSWAPRRPARTSCSPRWTPSAGTAWSSCTPPRSSSPSQRTWTRSGPLPESASDWRHDKITGKSLFFFFFFTEWKRDGVWMLVGKMGPVPFFTVDGYLCPTLADGPLDGLFLTPNSQTGGIISTLRWTSPA